MAAADLADPPVMGGAETGLTHTRVATAPLGAFKLSSDPLFVDKVTASRLYQMARERGYHGSQSHFRRLVTRERPRPVAEA